MTLKRMDNVLVVVDDLEAARELRDRSIEQINAPGRLLLAPSANGKCDVSRQLESAPSAMKVAPISMPEAA